MKEHPRFPSGVALGREKDLGFASEVFFLYTGDMNLVTRKEAAKAIYMSEGIIAYWIRLGRLKTYPVPGSSRKHLIDLDQTKELAQRNKRDILMKDVPSNLISTKEAGRLIYVTDRQICYYAGRGYIKKHYVLGNDRHYLVERDEVLAQIDLIPVRLRHRDNIEVLREKATKMKRDARGWWMKEDSNG